MEKAVAEIMDDVQRNGDEAICKATRLNPDIIIMDLIMPHKDGVSAITELKEKYKDKIASIIELILDEDLSDTGMKVRSSTLFAAD